MVSADLIPQHSLEQEDRNDDRAAVHEVVPSRGLLFRETSAQPVLCKPKLMPLQSISLEKLERLQAQQKTQQQQPPKSH
ncbi:hypothetical protein MTO96_021214 [Rhipicephalus appendiculatus]